MAKPTKERILETYVTEEGREPFTEWIESVRDTKTRIRIRRYIDRIEAGNLGDHK